MLCSRVFINRKRMNDFEVIRYVPYINEALLLRGFYHHYWPLMYICLHSSEHEYILGFMEMTLKEKKKT